MGSPWGASKLKSQGTLTINKHVDKVLVDAVCYKCKTKGMAYEDPNSRIKKPHLCIRCIN